MISKEIILLKSPSNYSNFYNSRIDFFDGIYGLPITEYNYQNYRELISKDFEDKQKYIKDETYFYLQINNLDNKTICIIKIKSLNIDKFTNDIHLNIIYQELDFQKKLFKKVLVLVLGWINSLFLPNNLLIAKNNIETDKIKDLIKEDQNDCILLKLKSSVGETMILTAGPSIGVREKIYSADATINGWNNQWNKYLSKFEQEFADYIGVKYAIATSSCTGAMHIALAALDLKEGDEVIVPDITWVSTANAVMLVGATPIFADVDIDTWTLDPKSVESLITDKTKAIMPVHLYGHPAKMDEIMSLGKKYNLKIIEDAAPSIGAEFNEKKTGSFGDFSAFSFQGAKLLVTGEGGMLCTNNKDLYEKAHKIWNQGRVPGTFWIEELSSKYKMSNIQAAIGLGQLQRNDLMVNKKRIINDWYYNRLKKIKGIKFFRESQSVKSIYWMSCIILEDENVIRREEFCKKLKERNIDTRPVFPTISQYPYWIKKQKEQPNSKLISERAINLPSGVCLSKDEIDYVCDQIIKILDQ